MFLKYSLFIAFILLISFTQCGREDLTAPLENNTPPAIPSGLKIDGAFDGQIGISWEPNNEDNISGYNVYRSTGNQYNFKLVKSTINYYYDDKDLEYDSTYFYKVSAFNNSNLESGLSEPVSAIPRNKYAPLQPYTVNINARNQEGIKSIFLSWSPSIDNDIAYYSVYRDTMEFEVNDDSKLLAKISNTYYSDTSDLILFQKYYYRIAAVDRGGLKSPPTNAVFDFILDEPVLISPVNGSEVNEISEFKIKTASRQADYKLIVQNNPAGGTIKEIVFSSYEPAKEITVDTHNLQLEPYKTYFWRVLTYTNNNSEPNSYSGIFSFYYNPK